MAGTLYILVVTCLTVQVAFAEDIGSFWQLTDVHYDANYSATSSQCHSPGGSTSSPESSTHGEYGDYRCDAPWRLVVSAISAMKRLKPDADFIVWTGDSVPHVPDSSLSPSKVLSLVHNVTAQLRLVFPHTPIFPVLGNHDAWPANQLPPRPDGYYDSVLYSSGWAELLGDDAKETFRKGGFYSLRTPGGQTVLGVNTVLYYTNDHLGLNLTDPGLQLMWLEDQLGRLRATGEKAFLIGHVPPGTMSRAPMQWFQSNFNDAFLRLLQEFSDCLLAAIFGHEHTDSFKIVYQKGIPVLPVFMSPAVTPWRSSVPGIGANNPSLRLYDYDRASGRLLDYRQYYLNLTAANSAQPADWLLEYGARAAFGLSDVSAPELQRLVDTFWRSPSAEFDAYFRYNSVSEDAASSCEGDCKVRQLCAITNISYTVYQQCVATRGRFVVSSHFPADMLNHHGNTAPRPLDHRGDQTPAFMYILVVAVVTLVSVMMLTLTVLCCRRRHVNSYFSQPHYTPINA